ncbi:hypothetical protein [Parvibaculum sp.]|uniref:hypothetical protein n=1 Tax=Parvibaculum sp. TaxID=2024848 RepID=UPI001D51CAD2|nr:hypothetical protein [Parvibaculum sp.]MBX3490883.1 hypothetical protein [Parvibaculum sp.]
MTDPTSPLGKLIGPGAGDPNTINRYARKFWHAGGALILPHQFAELTAAAKSEIEKVMTKAYGRRNG